LALTAVAAVAALAFFGLRSEHGPPGGPKAPELPREPLVGGPVSISSFVAGAHGRPSLVLFWASWCGPCIHEARAVERFSQTSQGVGRIVGVDWSDAVSGARAFISQYHWSFPDVRDAEGTVGNSYRLLGLPTTFVLDGSGRIKRALRGPQTEASLRGALAAAEGS
jgi:cytochrome c biogenesis protein CcmG, thiol:disulfide interchange protein DsbE